jgi:hypothetical protein
MSKKIDRATHGPGMVEIVLGVVLSIILGVALGAVLLILRPTPTGKDVPKEPAKGVVYYIEGSKDTSKAKSALAKRKAFVEGQSVTVTEDEINSLINPTAATPPPPPAKAGDKAKAPEKGKEAAGAAAPASDETVAVGQPNVRINNGEMQIGVPVTINALGLGQKVIVQARGGFVKKDSGFVFEPSSMYFGSCPLDKLPFLAGYVQDKALAMQPIPEDIKTSWAKLANVTIENNALKLTMP